MTLPAIRPMRPADIAPAAAAILRDDWGDRRSWFEFATSQPACRPVVAEVDAEIVGTGVGTVNGAAGWVGTIWVDPRHRGRGLGRALTRAVVENLEAAGCRTLLLVATDEGRPLYERMGFSVQTRYQILEAPGLEAGPSDRAVRAFEPPDLDAIVRLDRTATGEDREHALRRFAGPASSRVVPGPRGAVRGFVIRAPWGGGATVAPEIGDALRILAARRLAAGPAGRVRVGLLQENEAGLAALARLGLKPVWSAPRLIRGEALDWRPDWIWGQLNHAIG